MTCFLTQLLGKVKLLVITPSMALIDAKLCFLIYSGLCVTVVAVNACYIVMILISSETVLDSMTGEVITALFLECTGSVINFHFTSTLWVVNCTTH